MKKNIFMLSICVGLCLLAFFAGKILGPTPTISTISLQQQVHSAVFGIEPSLVRIISQKELDTSYTQLGGGNGVVCASKGLILTNKHVAEDLYGNYVVSFTDGSSYPVTRVSHISGIDLAILQINKQGLPIPSFSTGNSKQGDFVVSATLPLKDSGSRVDFGVISAMNMTLTLADDSIYTGLYLSTIDLIPGNSGSPLLTLNGLVIGINTAITYDKTANSFAIPVSQNLIQHICKM